MRLSEWYLPFEHALVLINAQLRKRPKLRQRLCQKMDPFKSECVAGASEDSQRGKGSKPREQICKTTRSAKSKSLPVRRMMRLELERMRPG